MLTELKRQELVPKRMEMLETDLVAKVVRKILLEGKD